jgi:hypothetical protein
MSKTKTFESTIWGGSVTFHDPLTIEQEAAWEYAYADLQKARERGGGISAILIAALPGIDACVEKWELKNFPERPTLADWPMHQKVESAKLLACLVKNILELYNDSVNIPNA